MFLDDAWHFFPSPPLATSWLLGVPGNWGCKLPSPCLMDSQDGIDCHRRSAVVDWLVDVALELQFQDQTLFLATHLLDRILSRVVVETADVQDIGLACMWIASKYTEVMALTGSQMVSFVGGHGTLEMVSFLGGYGTLEHLLATERSVLEILQYDINIVSSLDILECLLMTSATAMVRPNSMRPNTLLASLMNDSQRSEASSCAQSPTAHLWASSSSFSLGDLPSHSKYSSNVSMSECPLLMRQISSSGESSGSTQSGSVKGNNIGDNVNAPYGLMMKNPAEANFDAARSEMHLDECRGPSHGMCACLGESPRSLSSVDGTYSGAGTDGDSYLGQAPSLPYTREDTQRLDQAMESSDQSPRTSAGSTLSYHSYQSTHLTSNETPHAQSLAQATEQTLTSPLMLEITCTARFYCEVALMDHRMGHWKSSQIASAALLLAHRQVGVHASESSGDNWPMVLQDLVGYSAESLGPVVACLGELQLKYSTHKELNAVYYKYCKRNACWKTWLCTTSTAQGSNYTFFPPPATPPFLCVLGGVSISFPFLAKLNVLDNSGLGTLMCCDTSVPWT
eukprot:gene27761-7401_t